MTGCCQVELLSTNHVQWLCYCQVHVTRFLHVELLSTDHVQWFCSLTFFVISLYMFPFCHSLVCIADLMQELISVDHDEINQDNVVLLQPAPWYSIPTWFGLLWSLLNVMLMVWIHFLLSPLCDADWSFDCPSCPSCRLLYHRGSKFLFACVYVCDIALWYDVHTNVQSDGKIKYIWKRMPVSSLT